MPSEMFYVRSNFGVPQVDLRSWRLSVGGLVGLPDTYSIDDLRALGESTELVTLECAGNGRLLMDPVPDGAPWKLGAVGVAEFTGVALRRVLEPAQTAAEVIEFVFTGADRGSVESDGAVNYAFSLTRDEALGGGPMLAWAMNGEPLSVEHGAPLRLVVPGNYGMSSVKWLTTITAVDRPFTGHFRQKYRYLGDPVAPEEAPVGRMRVRSLMTSPADGDEVGGEVVISGIAWSGHGPIAAVEVGIDGQRSDALLGSPFGRFGPTPWSVAVPLDPGPHTLAARATDAVGNTQPLDPIWNRNGYANNVVHRIEVTASDP
ncbi:MAG: sulfite oxidase [Acidimicrobiia bacterium]